MGLFSLLYPEQNNVLNHWHQVKSISYKDQSIAMETLLFSLFFALSKNEKTIVVIPDPEMRKRFLGILNDWSLDSLFFYYDPNQSVTKDDIEQLQKKIQRTIPEKDHSVDLEFLQFRHEKIHAEVTAILQSFHVFDAGRNLLTVLERKEDVSSFLNKSMIDAQRYEILPDLTEPEFDRLYDQIVYASSLYDPEFYQTRNSRKFKISAKYTQNEPGIDDFIHQMSSYVGRMENLREQYFTLMNEMQEDQVTTLRQLYSKAQSQLAQFIFLDQLIAKYKKQEAGVNWQKVFGRESDLVSSLVSHWKKVLENLKETFTLLPDFKTREFDLAVLEKETFQKQNKLKEVETSLTEWFKGALEKQKIVFKHSNIFNQREAKYLQDLETDFHVLIDEINHANLLENTLEINTLSIQKHTELLSTYIQECVFLMNDVKQNKRYYLWEHFYENASETIKTTIRVLQHFPTKDWPIIAEYVFLRHWIESGLNPNFENLTSLTGDLYRTSKELPGLWTLEKSRSKLQERNLVLKNLSGIDKSLLQKILANKDLDRLNWRYFFEQNARLWSNLFDIVITPEDKFEDIEPGLFSNLLYLNPKSINAEVLHLGKTIHTYYTETEIPCDLHIPQGMQVVMSESKSFAALTQLQTSKILAENFFSLQTKFSVFQSRRANVISCLYPHINITVFNGMDEGLFKELSPGEKDIHMLTECILESSRQKYLILHDHFLDPSGTDTYCVQLRVIEDFKRNGFTILSLSTASLMARYQESLEYLHHQINA